MKEKRKELGCGGCVGITEQLSGAASKLSKYTAGEAAVGLDSFVYVHGDNGIPEQQRSGGST